MSTVETGQRPFSAFRRLSASDPSEAAGALSGPRAYSRSSARSRSSDTAFLLRRMRRPVGSASSTGDLHLAADRERLQHVRVAIDARFGKRQQPGAARRQEHEHAELLVTLNLASQDRPWRDRALSGRGPRRPFVDERDADALLRGIDAEDFERPGRADGHRFRPSSRATSRGKRGRVRQPFDAGVELHEGAEVRHADHSAGTHLAHLVGRGDRRPRIVLELLQPERDLLRGIVYTQHLHGDLLTGRDDFIGTGAA